MGSKVSVPLGAYVIAYNDTGATKSYGDRVTGDKLKPSYIPGSYPFSETFTNSDTFECRGYCRVRSNGLWQRVS